MPSQLDDWLGHGSDLGQCRRGVAGMLHMTSESGSERVNKAAPSSEFVCEQCGENGCCDLMDGPKMPNDGLRRTRQGGGKTKARQPAVHR